MRMHRSVLTLATVFAAALSAPPPAHAQRPITLVSVDSNGVQENDDSTYGLAISADGRFVAFVSYATNLVANDTNGSTDVFVHDRVTGATELLSRNSAGVQGNSDSYDPALSGDGRFLAFASRAGNLVSNDGNFADDVFVHDRDPDGNGKFDEGNGVTTRASVNSAGKEADGMNFRPSISADGNLVAFYSYADNLVFADGNGRSDVFVRDRAKATTTRVSVDSSGNEGDADSFEARISADGTTVAFASTATNLVANDANGVIDVFVRDRVNKITERVSVDSSGGETNGDSRFCTVSADGGVVAFSSAATNLVAGDVNGLNDIFVRDRVNATTTRVSVDSSGNEGDMDSFGSAISADGTVVVFWSAADDLVANDTNQTSDVFVHERTTGQTTVASMNCEGAFGDGASPMSSISADGQQVAILSFAENLVSADANGSGDVFVHDRTIPLIDASWNNYGAGFPGTNGIPALTASADPVFGTTISLDIGNSYTTWTSGLLLVGLDPASIQTGAGATILVDLLFTIPVVITPSGTSILATIPSDDQLFGLSAFLQAIELDAGAKGNLSFTPGLELVFGT
jgi:cold shock CspA family protein